MRLYFCWTHKLLMTTPLQQDSRPEAQAVLALKVAALVPVNQRMEKGGYKNFFDSANLRAQQQMLKGDFNYKRFNKLCIEHGVNYDY